MLATALAASPLDRSGDLSAPPRAADLPNRTRSWFRPAGGVSDCPLDAPVILLKMARAGSSDVVQNLGKALPACRWDAELLHETNEILNAGDYNKCNDAALAEEQRLFLEAMGERSIISHNPVSTAGGCFSSGRLGPLDGRERDCAFGWRHAKQHALPQVGRACPRHCTRHGALAVQHATAARDGGLGLLKVASW